jgi:hypothetical protein
MNVYTNLNLNLKMDNLVNICPALAIPKGSTLNTKYLDLPWLVWDMECRKLRITDERIERLLSIIDKL